VYGVILQAVDEYVYSWRKETSVIVQSLNLYTYHISAFEKLGMEVDNAAQRAKVDHRRIYGLRLYHG
jgi:hypothetical protein